MIDELALLLDKVMASEDLVRRLELYFDEHQLEWRDDIRACFLDQLERKKDQIDYEWHRVRRMGQAVAAGRDHRQLDI